MSEEKSGSTGQILVLTVIGVIVAVYAINVINYKGPESHEEIAVASHSDSSHDSDHGEVQTVEKVVIKIDETKLNKVTAERDAALAEVAALRAALKGKSMRLEERDHRLGLVKNLLDAEAALSN
jgi:hypothetical protein